MPETKARPEKRLGVRMVPLDDLVPHPLNANVMPEDLREKLKAHIKRTGRYPFLVVRPHPVKFRLKVATRFRVIGSHSDRDSGGGDPSFGVV